MPETPSSEPPRKVPLRDIFRVFFIVGASSFGGGVISWMHRLMVGQRRWLSDEKFLSGLALAQVLPGANVSNMALYIGQVLRGAPGAFIALLAVLTGPFFLVIGVATVYDSAILIPGFHSAMDGIAAAAVGMVLRMGATGALHSCRKAAPALIALGVFIAIGILQWPLAPVALVAAPLSVALAWPWGRKGGAQPMRDDPYFNLILILVPFSLLSIGGGPSIFAPLQREVVDVMHWLTAREFIDLFSIARVAPGPGAMLTTLIGWKVGGWAGAIVATLALFLPASILTLMVARVYDRYRGREWHTALEAGLAPVAVGLIFAGAISIIRLSGNAPITWAAAVGAGLALTLRPRMHPFVVLFAGLALFVAAEIAGLWPIAAP